MSKQVIATESAPAAVGPYVQAIKTGRFVFTSGQIALDPESGAMVAAPTPAEEIPLQTRQVLTNLTAVLAAAGTDLSQVVKTTVFLASMDDFAAMNEVYAEVFGDNRPARSTVGVAGLPLGARVEIEVVALIPKEGKGKKKKKGKKGKKK